MTRDDVGCDVLLARAVGGEVEGEICHRTVAVTPGGWQLLGEITARDKRPGLGDRLPMVTACAPQRLTARRERPPRR